MLTGVTIVVTRHTKVKDGDSMIRYVTYDIKEGNSYESLYDYFKERKAKKVTESTYQVDSTLKWEDFCNKIKGLTSAGDNVSIISCNTNGIFHKKVR